jgi:hypothetical protein
MSKFTRGRYSWGICDRCGDKVKFTELKKEEHTGLKVCDGCLDPKTKLEYPSNTPFDPESLYDPRPDGDKEASIGRVVAEDNTSGGTPIGKMFDPNKTTISVGTVTVSIT